jgi:hypothetical protein
MESHEFTNLEQLLERVEAAVGSSGRVSLGAILEEVGRSSFSPLLLIAGLITVAPVIGDIPGVPTTMAIFVSLTAGQLLFGRDHFWLPQWLLKRSIPKDRLCRTLAWMGRPARFVDRFLRPRLRALTGRSGTYAIASACLLIASALPASELIPLTANGLGAALTAYGLALVAGDGLMALIAFAFTAITFGLALFALI